MSEIITLKRPSLEGYAESGPIQDFIFRIINGSGGFKTWEDRECVIFADREIGVAEFVVRCLANPRCEGSREVLDLILEQRKEN